MTRNTAERACSPPLEDGLWLRAKRWIIIADTILFCLPPNNRNLWKKFLKTFIALVAAIQLIFPIAIMEWRCLGFLSLWPVRARAKKRCMISRLELIRIVSQAPILLLPSIFKKGEL